MAVAPLNFDANPQAFSAFDFTPLAKLGQVFAPKQNDTLASLGDRYGAPPGEPPAPGMPRQPAVPYSSAGTGDYGSGGAGGSNVQSWYDFARKPLDQGGLGLTHEQAVGKVANLQAESGRDIKPWGVTGDAGTAFGAAQWRGDRFNNLQKFASDRGLDYRTTDAQQAFMRQEYLTSERSAYDALLSARTPQEAATAVNKYYERSADTTGGREARAARLATQLLPGGQ
jgi:hypothetical protein